MQSPVDIEYNEDNNRMYIVSFNTVNIVETSNMGIVVVGSIPNPAPTPNGIEGIVYNPDKKLIYFIHTGQVFPPDSVFYDTVSVFRTSDNTRIDTITLDADRNAVDLVYDPHKKQMYLLHRAIRSPTDTDIILVIRTSDNTIVDRISLPGHNSFDIIYNSTEKQIYVTEAQNNTVSVIQTSDNTLVDTISVGTQPDGMAYNPNKKRLYVANRGENTLSVIRTSDNSVITTIPAGNTPEKIAYNPHKKRIYVTDHSGGTVTVINASNNTIIKTIPVEVIPFGIAYDLNKREIWVTHLPFNVGVDGFVSVISKNDL